MSSHKLAQTAYGFQWGPAHVNRNHGNDKNGVWLEVVGAKERVQIRVTPSGRIRVLGVEKKETK